ncbi:molecular chaperone [Stenotrophomonas sp. PS02298]|uniref:fimbrial biogenesis chaperone n=1 Tax=Stenotrophomonas sp. PS02298 TaxID=2991424 RepID=UPI00249AE88E|nr:molecular chaperone [Stenotrophomonas sp. PS02298]
MHQVPTRRYATCTAIAGIFALLSMGVAEASVVVSGTRVIYPADAKQVTVQLTNQDAFPNAVQAWVDVDNPQSTPADADGPFVVTPAVSRMAPGAGQRIRVMFAGQDVPNDRESVFHLNVLQVPPMNTALADQNKVMVLMRNRLKMFYRPMGIAGTPAQIPEQLRFRIQQSGNNWHVQVENPTGYHASFGGATLSVAGANWKLTPAMVPPMGSAQWMPLAPTQLPAGEAVVSAHLINDYGARIAVTHAVAR